MGREDELLILFQNLDDEGIDYTEEFVRDIRHLIKSNVKSFVVTFLSDFLKKDFQTYNRFELLRLSNGQKMQLKNKQLYRYEYRKTSNFRCIFILNDRQIPILLCAFNEDWDKSKGDNTYDFNIARAIKIFKSIKYL